MEFRGIYQDGVIRPTQPVNLPEGTEVEFHVANGQVDAARPALRTWESKSIEELAREQGVGPIKDLRDLAGDWPEDDDIDEFLSWLRESRGR